MTSDNMHSVMMLQTQRRVRVLQIFFVDESITVLVDQCESLSEKETESNF